MNEFQEGDTVQSQGETPIVGIIIGAHDWDKSASVLWLCPDRGPIYCYEMQSDITPCAPNVGTSADSIDGRRLAAHIRSGLALETL